MNKNLYRFGSFFLGLTVACNLLQAVAHLWVGTQLFKQGSFIAWFWVFHIVSMTGVIMVLKYYHYRKYLAAFYTGIAAAIASFCYSIVFFTMLFSPALRSYYLPVALVYLLLNIIHALILLFSKTRERAWLRIAGAYMLVIGIVLLATIIWPLTQWASLAGSFISIPFMINFLRERKDLSAESPIPLKTSLNDSLITMNALATIAVIVTGIWLMQEGGSSVYWSEKNFENTKKLAQLFEARTYINTKGDTLFYHLLRPLHFDPAKKYPLVISLPYGGQPATDRVRQMEGAAAAELLSTEVNREKYPAFLFIPNCPPGSGWGGVPNYPAVDPLVYEAISDLDKEPGIDPKRRYVTGISRGGYGTWHFICTRPDLFAAAIPVCGAEDPKLAARIDKVAVWAFHGAKDRNVPVAGSRGMIEAMRRSGQNPKYTEYPDEGHNIWYQVSNTAGLWDWLFAQKRD